MHQYSSGFILQWYLLSPRTKNKPADCDVDVSHECAAHASARHAFHPRHRRRSRVGKTTWLLCGFASPAHMDVVSNTTQDLPLAPTGFVHAWGDIHTLTLIPPCLNVLAQIPQKDPSLSDFQPGLVVSLAPPGAGVKVSLPSHPGTSVRHHRSNRPLTHLTRWKASSPPSPHWWGVLSLPPVGPVLPVHLM